MKKWTLNEKDEKKSPMESEHNVRLQYYSLIWWLDKAASHRYNRIALHTKTRSKLLQWEQLTRQQKLVVRHQQREKSFVFFFLLFSWLSEKKSPHCKFVTFYEPKIMWNNLALFCSLFTLFLLRLLWFNAIMLWFLAILHPRFHWSSFLIHTHKNSFIRNFLCCLLFIGSSSRNVDVFFSSYNYAANMPDKNIHYVEFSSSSSSPSSSSKHTDEVFLSSFSSPKQCHWSLDSHGKLCLWKAQE